MDLLHAIEAGAADELVQQCGRIGIMVNDLDAAHRALAAAGSTDLLRDQTRRFVSPLRQLLRRGIDLLGETDTAPQNAEHRRQLRETLSHLDASLRVLG